MRPKFWKLSQGTTYFSFQEIIQSIEQKLVYVHKETSSKGNSEVTQAQAFVDCPVGDYFYLTHGNTGIYLLGQLSGPANIFSQKGEGWLDRPYRFIRASTNQEAYSGEIKWWTPNENSTFTAVPDSELRLFETLILKPYFDISLKKFGIN